MPQVTRYIGKLAKKMMLLEVKIQTPFVCFSLELWWEKNQLGTCATKIDMHHIGPFISFSGSFQTFEAIKVASQHVFSSFRKEDVSKSLDAGISANSSKRKKGLQKFVFEIRLHDVYVLLIDFVLLKNGEYLIRIRDGLCF